MNYNLLVRDLNVETFILHGKINDKELIENLKNTVREKAKDSTLNYKTNVKGLFTGFRSLINDKYFIKFLELIKNEMKLVYNSPFIIKDAWGNICKENDEVLIHDHIETTAFCSILYLTDGGPGTYFSNYDLNVDEEIGKFVLFSPILKHKVSKLDKNIERITIAFNADQEKNWVNYENGV